jgi:hypothetical protein
MIKEENYKNRLAEMVKEREGLKHPGRISEEKG